ncbi:multidrug resistance-associated protein 5-like [Acanthaster planci]|uniref:ATP-binding cassette sub-family C member 5 n=1 Tax=Acanthaster planci TaxID=133434 RepID=A0A8B7YRS1_ACAPL|nr:multidrug resistance-associated protein 5-like [Acanthaster planci]XP_022095165.1 multidrug resistance-associated protein 5-like [Acanthaster planci]
MSSSKTCKNISSPMQNRQEKQGTRPSGQNVAHFEEPKVTTKEPPQVYRFQKFFRKAQTKRRKLHANHCPMDQANILSTIWFCWLTPVFYKAWKGTLSKEDLFSCSPYDSAKINCDRLERLWQNELKHRGPEKASLARVYFWFLVKRSIFSCLSSFIAIMANCVSSAVLVRLLLEYCQQQTSNLGYGLMLAGLMVLCQVMLVTFMSFGWYMNIRTGGRVRAATVCLIYQKTIGLRTLKGLSIGEIVNLCANDGQRLFDMLLYLPHALAGPLLAAVALIYTVYLIGPAALLGTGVFIIFYPLQGVFSKITAHYRQHAITVTDLRVRLMSEIINCIKLIKMYAWEESFEANIGDIRQREQGWLEKAGFFQSFCQSLTTFVPILSSILTLSLHTLLGHNITAAQAFSYIAILNAIRFMIIATPLAIKSLTETFVAFPRIKSLLLMDDLKEFHDKPSDPNLALSLRGATFAWDKEEPTGTPDVLQEDIQDTQAGSPEDEVNQETGLHDQANERPEMDPLIHHDSTVTETLFDINLDVWKGQLLGICGSIGSGKSSFLQSVLSRMILIDGKVAVDGSFAYVSQQACIMNVTLRENILMGAEFNQERYDQAINACALQDDIEILPDGDETEIGERGINISGGQKQRVSLARAVYSDKEIYLLDDPLSAVDTHVGKHIFSECIEGALKGKTILFVTHQLQYLKCCDRIILMKDGRIVEDGTHNKLMESGNEYCSLIKTFHSDDADEDVRDNPKEGSSSHVSIAEINTNDADEPISSNKASVCSHTEETIDDSSIDDEESKDSSEPMSDLRQDNDSQGNADSIGHAITGRSNCHGDPSSLVKSSPDDHSQTSHDSSSLKIMIVVPDDVTNESPGIRSNSQDFEPNLDKSNSLNHITEDDGKHLDEASASIKDAVAKEVVSDKEDDSDEKMEDCEQNDQCVSRESSPVKKNVALPMDLLQVLSADSGSMGGGVQSEETIFYSGKLIEEEELGERGITIETINSYIQSAGGFLVTVGVLFCYAVSVGFTVFSSWWLSHWLNNGSGNTTITVDNVTVISDSITDNPRLRIYQLVYGLSAAASLSVIAFRCFVYAKMTLRASSNLHKNVFQKVMHSPMSFFDTTPLGRILNRFSKDLDELDITLPYTINPLVNNTFLIVFSMVTVTFVFPHLLAGLVIIFIVFSFLNFFFRHGLRELKKFDNLARSPWFSHIMTTVQSLPTIHAYRKQKEFTQRFHVQLDDSTNIMILFYLANRWLAIRFDFITILLTGGTALLVVLTHGSIPAATAGLAIIYANQLLGISQHTVRLAAEANARFTSVERINYYIQNLQQEAPRTIKHTKPPSTWPSEGRITLKNLKMRYRQHLPLVLRGLSFEIRPKEKVGIVGRTGSGKSSLGVALYRLVEKTHGSIMIDGIDINQIGLYDLRSKLSIIPQDPVLFIGTIRYNLDPTNQFTDDEVWKALEKTYMKETISGLDQQLQAPVIENGENFSVGERQLLCMARALLRNSKILILDEATAAIDTETDSLVQQTIRQAFTQCTILTIAHRLNTILDSDRILVLSDGRVLEFDSPSKLLADPSSYFTAMMSAMGDQTH